MNRNRTHRLFPEGLPRKRPVLGPPILQTRGYNTPLIEYFIHPNITKIKITDPRSTLCPHILNSFGLMAAGQMVFGMVAPIIVATYIPINYELFLGLLTSLPI